MRISNNGKNFIKKLENIGLNAYLDSGGVPSIGYGNTKYLDGSNVRIGDVISQEEADILFDGRIAQDEYTITRSARLANITLFQNQFDALCSIRYNSGSLGRKEYSPTFWERVVAKKITIDFIKNYLRYDRAGNDVLGSRRLAESNLFFGGNY